MISNGIIWLRRCNFRIMVRVGKEGSNVSITGSSIPSACGRCLLCSLEKILGNTLDETLFSLELRRTVTRILLISHSSGGADARSLPTND